MAEKTNKGIASFECGNGNTMEIIFPTVVSTPLLFNVQFRRTEDYNGEFGFDWMRDAYKPEAEGGKGISLNYEDLKTEYNITSDIDDKEYFVPWLSMFPNQENVKLQLVYETLGKPKSKNIIKIPTEQEGINIKVLQDGTEVATETSENGEETFYQLKVRDLQKKVSESDENYAKENDNNEKKKEITLEVSCNTMLTEDTLVKIFDENDKTVGLLNIVKNDVLYDLKVRVVKVVREENKATDLNGLNTRLIDNEIDDFLKKNSLQQGLIKINLDNSDDYVVELSEEDLRNKLKTGSRTEFKESYKNSISGLFSLRYKQRYETESHIKHKGVLLFVTVLQKPGSAGSGVVWVGDSRHCNIFYAGLDYESTYAHEIAHVLGCEHSHEIDDADIKIEKNNEDILRYENKIQEERDKISENLQKITEREDNTTEMKNYPNNPTAISNIDINTRSIGVLNNMIETSEEKINGYEKRIEREREVTDQIRHVDTSNKYLFKEGLTDNFMDYTSPKSKRKCFWRKQWNIMQEDIKKYYN